MVQKRESCSILMKRFLATLLAAATLGLTAHAGFKEGLSAYLQGDYAKALKEWQPLAEQGDADAQFSLGVMYANGQGVPQDDKEALNWYRKAAEQGVAGAQFNLGLMYKNGQGVPQDYKEAANWYRKAAEQGVAGAQNNLGRMYAFGQGVPKDHKEAANWYRKAAEQGHAGAQNNLGAMYETGLGVPEDKILAYALYNLSAAGDPSENNKAPKNRDTITAELSRNELTQGQALTRELIQTGNFGKALDGWLTKRAR
jgi:TPR repeat protein